MKLVAGAAMVGVSLGLVGCESSDAIVTETPTPTPTSPVISSSDASPSPSASGAASASPGASPEVSGAPLTDEELLEILPPGAELTDLQGALATSQFFLEQYATMFHTGDATVWKALSLEGCVYCEDALKNAEQVRDSSWTAEGGAIVVLDDRTRGDLAQDGIAYVTLVADVEQSVLTDPDGKKKLSDGTGRATYTVKMKLVDGLWRVEGVDIDV